MFWRDLEACVVRHLAGAERTVIIAAPFIKCGAFVRLLEAIPASVVLSVYTRWRPEEVAAGVSDPQILDFTEGRPATEVWLCDQLHAKLYLVDEVRALIGSANVTAAGLGTASASNLELLQAVDVAAATSALFLVDLRARSRAATRAEAMEVLAVAAELKAKTPPEAPTASDAQEDGPQGPEAWFPRFRSPDRLYDLARDSDWIASASPADPALQDLLALGVNADAEEANFDSQVRERLRASRVIVALDEFLAEPQRFGALTDWLRGVLPTADHDQRQATGQTLIRWITYFDPERYEIAVPGAFSEVLSLRKPSGVERTD